MQKFMILFVMLILLWSCSNNVEPLQSLPNGAIDSDYQKQLIEITIINNEYTSQNKFIAEVLFKNKTGEDIYIINTGCFFPSFVLEIFNRDKWEVVGAPLCVALAVPSTKLENNNSIIKTVSMYSDPLVSGFYRLRLDIHYKRNGLSIPIENVVSHSFKFAS